LESEEEEAGTAGVDLVVGEAWMTWSRESWSSERLLGVVTAKDAADGGAAQTECLSDPPAVVPQSAKSQNLFQ
jgi:hypothetical protein